MSATPANPQEPQNVDSGPPLFVRQKPSWREPTWADGWLFFVAIPAAMGFMFSLVGVALINQMSWLQSLVYMLLHMFVGWWTVSLGCTAIKYAFRSWKPPTIIVCLVGLMINNLKSQK